MSSFPIIHFSDTVKAGLLQGFGQITATDIAARQEHAGFILTTHLSVDQAVTISQFTAGLHPMILFKNAPIEADLPPTPLDGVYPADQGQAAVNFTLGAFDCTQATAISYTGENNGLLTRAVVPAYEGEAIEGSHGSTTPLSFHTDGAFLAFPNEQGRSGFAPSPDILSLFCLRGDPEAKTDFILLYDLVDALPRKILKSLQKPLFSITPPMSFTTKIDALPKVPIMWIHPLRGPMIRYYDTRVTAHDEEGKVALTGLRQAMSQSKYQHQVVLEAGDCVLFNNHLLVHGRTPFQAKSDGLDRWLARLYGIWPDSYATIPPAQFKNPHLVTDYLVI